MEGNLADVVEVAKLLAASGYFTDVRDMAQAVAKILAGREIGLGPVASLTGVYIERGKPCYSANAIAAAIKRSGTYNYTVQRLDTEACTLVFSEAGKEVGASTFTLHDAEHAGLLSGKNAHSWRHYPRNMLFARALTNGARWYCPDVGSGVGLYTPEEIGAPVHEGAGVLEASAPVMLTAQPPAAEAAVSMEASPAPALLVAPPQAALPPEVDPQSALPDRQPDGPVITAGQLKVLCVMQRRSKVSDDQIHAWLRQQYAVTSRKDIRQTDLNDVLEWIEERGALEAA
jgi:hypothetical protein